MEANDTAMDVPDLRFAVCSEPQFQDDRAFSA
jgi:hypothetical protein